MIPTPTSATTSPLITRNAPPNCPGPGKSRSPSVFGGVAISATPTGIVAMPESPVQTPARFEHPDASTNAITAAAVLMRRA